MSGDNKKDLRLVDERIDKGDLDACTDALRAVLAPRELGTADHEALLAMTLGDDVVAIDDAERAQAELLGRALDGRGEHPLARLGEALRAAHGATALATVDHEIMVALATGNEPALSDEDIQSAEALARALDGEGTHELATLATALSACNGADIDELGHERVLRRTLFGGDPRHGERTRRGALVTTLVALAAGIALFAGSWQWLETKAGPTSQLAPVSVAAVPAAELVSSRSTAELFDPTQPFPSKGGESERMDRIVSARAADLRANRFASWGVK
jgi:hypothetical protein